MRLRDASSRSRRVSCASDPAGIVVNLFSPTSRVVSSSRRRSRWVGHFDSPMPRSRRTVSDGRRLSSDRDSASESTWDRSGLELTSRTRRTATFSPTVSSSKTARGRVCSLFRCRCSSTSDACTELRASSATYTAITVFVISKYKHSHDVARRSPHFVPVRMCPLCSFSSCHLRFCFDHAACMHSTDYVIARCLSVHLSVTRRYA